MLAIYDEMSILCSNKMDRKEKTMSELYKDGYIRSTGKG